MERDLAVTATGDVEAAKPLEIPSPPTPAPSSEGTDTRDAPNAPTRTVAVRRLLGGAWRARGFFGGLGAIALAAFGQYTLVNQQDQPTALLCYEAAIVLLIASLLHPTLPRLPFLFAPRAESATPTAPAGSIAAPPLPVRTSASQET